MFQKSRMGLQAVTGVARNKVNERIGSIANAENTETAMRGEESVAQDKIKMSLKKAELSLRTAPSAYAAKTAEEMARPQ